MLTARCPQCGANTPLSLKPAASILCDFCRQESPVTPALAAELDRARAALQASDVSKRQLDKKRLKAVTNTSWATVRFAAYSALFGAPLAVCLVSGLLFAEGDTQLVLSAVVCGGPLIAFFLAFLLGHLAVRRRINRVRASASAIPPVADGAPCRCHVCGGDLVVPADSRAVVRCDYCAADNLAGDALLWKQGTARVHDVDNFAVAVSREASSVHDASERIGLSMALAALMAPVAGAGISLLLLCGLTQFDLAPSTTELYGVVDTAAGPCLGEYIYGGTVLHFGESPPQGVSKQMDPLETEVLETVHGAELVGREVFWFDREGLRNGRVTGVISKMFGGNMVDIAVDPTGRKRRGLRGLCLD